MTIDVIPQSHRDLLDAKGFAHLASIGPDGAPQSHPVWYDWQNGRLLISTTTDRQKYRNVERDPHVAVSILDPEMPYRYLEIRGEVAEISPDEEKKFIDHLASKYLEEDEYPDKQPDADRVVIAIEAEHSTSMG